MNAAGAASADACAERLFAAIQAATQIAPFTATDPSFDVAHAYEVLERMHARRFAQGWRAIGRKIGFTNRTIWPRYGVDRPMWSFVWDRTVAFAQQGRAQIPLGGLMEPRIEPEVVFGLKAPLAPGDDPERVLAATEWIAPAFEVVHSVFPGWKFGASDCTAAYGLHGRLAVGTPMPVAAADRAALVRRLAAFPLTLRRGEQVVDTGVGANVLDSPVRAMLYLADVLARQPQFPPLAAGEFVSTGTLTDAWPVKPGETWSSDYGDLGLAPMTATFTA